MRGKCSIVVCLIVVSLLLLCPAYADEGAKYTLEQAKSISAATFLERMQNPEPGYHRFAALWALTDKVKTSTPDAQRSIISMVVSAMNDTSRTEYQRFQCCYVISGSGYEAGIPDLIRVLLNDPSEVMRSVAAEALGSFKGNKTAYDALLQSARTETSTRVREVLAKYLGSSMPAPPPGAGAPAPVGPIGSSDAQLELGEALLKQVWDADAGKAKFEAIDAVAKQLKAMDSEDRKAILKQFIAAMKNKSLGIYNRWPCCYVIGRTGEEQGLADIVLTLLFDDHETMRAVAAETLGGMRNNTTAREALTESARREANENVRKVIAKYLGDVMPELEAK